MQTWPWPLINQSALSWRHFRKDKVTLGVNLLGKVTTESLTSTLFLLTTNYCGYHKH